MRRLFSYLFKQINVSNVNPEPLVSSVTLPPLHSKTLKSITELVKIQDKEWNESSGSHTEIRTQNFI